jgi:hypothetical protein
METSLSENAALIKSMEERLSDLDSQTADVVTQFESTTSDHAMAARKVDKAAAQVAAATAISWSL